MFEYDLIRAIRQYPCLYDKTSRTTPLVYNKCWDNVAKETGVELKRCQSRWRSLRDRYVKENRNYIEFKRETMWRFMQKMDFLKDFINSRPTSVTNYKRSSTKKDSYMLRKKSRESEDPNYSSSKSNYFDDQDEADITSHCVTYLQDAERPLQEPSEYKRQSAESLIESEIDEASVSHSFKTEQPAKSSMNPIEAHTKFDALIDTLNAYIKSRISDEPNKSHSHFYGLLTTYFGKLPENEQDKLKAEILLMVLNKTKDL